MNRMVCRACGVVGWSAAARLLIERGERCERCGGELELREGIRDRAPATARERRRQAAGRVAGPDDPPEAAR